MPALSKLEAVPDEILEEIVLSIIESTFLGPPAALPGLLRLSRTISNILSRDNNPYLYARIFCCKFDLRATIRRFGSDCSRAQKLAAELVRRCEGLKRLRHDAYPCGAPCNGLDGGLRVDLWMAYIMFMESDDKNARQLFQYARIDCFALRFVGPGGRLHDETEDNEGWTVDSEVNALAVWLFWFTDDERVSSETPIERDQILGALGCFYAGSFKYTSTHAPLAFAIPPTMTHPPLAPQVTFSITASPLMPPCITLDYFGFKLNIARPLATPPALLACVARLGGGGGGMLRNSRAPATRAEAVSTGWIGATAEDYEAFGRLGTPGVEWGRGGASDRHDEDWMRLLLCKSPESPLATGKKLFEPGMLQGVWEGRWLAIPPDFFQSLLRTVQSHEAAPMPLQPPVFQYPMQFHLREHHQYDPDNVVDFDDINSDGVGRGSLRAWLPAGVTMVKRQGNLEVHVPNQKASIYRSYDPLQAALQEELPHVESRNERVWDTILTADTMEDFGEAWGHDRYMGRVRSWDGLVVLVREARPGAGRWVFRGYVHGSRNLVGRWRETGTRVEQPGWEGVWSMAKILT